MKIRPSTEGVKVMFPNSHDRRDGQWRMREAGVGALDVREGDDGKAWVAVGIASWEYFEGEL